MTKLLSAIVALFLCLPAYATPNPRAGSPTVLIRVIDGDSIVYGRTRIRALGYDTPEVKGRCQAEKDLAARATARMRELASAPNRFSLKWAKGKDEFGRGLATFYSNGRPVGSILISEGLARPYSRSAGRQGWC